MSTPPSKTISLERYKPCTNPSFLTKCELGIRQMRSHRWFPGSEKNILFWYKMPFITQQGYISPYTLYTWRCTPTQYFATLCRSVLKNLLKRNSKKRKKFKLCRDMIARIAIYYSLTQDKSTLERLMHCTSNTRKLLDYYLSQTDEPKRFLYGQMCNSILWLQSRGIPRASSIKLTYLKKYRNFQIENFDASSIINDYLKGLGTPSAAWLSNDRLLLAF